jgi:quinol monooxygenase YgiN
MITSPYKSASGTPEIIMLANVKLKEGCQLKFETLMKRVIAETRKEPGNIKYELLKVHGKNDTYIIYEKWKDQNALDLHMTQLYSQEVIELLAYSLTFPLNEVLNHIDFVEEIIPQY